MPAQGKLHEQAAHVAGYVGGPDLRALRLDPTDADIQDHVILLRGEHMLARPFDFVALSRRICLPKMRALGKPSFPFERQAMSAQTIAEVLSVTPNLRLTAPSQHATRATVQQRMKPKA